jgi:cell division septation protein DedD
MRFEIRSGGIAAILFAVALLSGAVFILGLLAGYDVGLETQRSTAQVATEYPLQAPPATPDVSTPASGPTTAGAVSNLAGGGAQPPAKSASPPDNSGAPASPGLGDVAAARQRLASGAAPAPASSGASIPDATQQTTAASPGAGNPGGQATPGPPRVASAERAPAPPRIHRKPFDIQIQAAMDLNGANEMIKRLQQLGYQPHLVPTNIDGQTWYRVEVGPYATQDEAAAAEAQLRQKYNAQFGGGHPVPADESDAE